MALWTSEYAILQALSEAQGRVPAAIEQVVVAGDRPPKLKITEETEEEFYKHGSVDANVDTAPDLGLIQEMLDMVRDDNETLDDPDTNRAVVICKLNPHCPEFVPSQKNTSTPNIQSPTKQIEKPKKRQRNIAVESILQAIADNSKNNEIVLLKPEDFITNNVESNNPKETETIPVPNETSRGGEDNTPTVNEKVNGWFETQTTSPFPKKTSKVTLEATNIVFKKKDKLKIDKASKENLRKLSQQSSALQYKPSALAGQLYLKYMENHQFQQSVQEDIWSKAEKKMKELDEKRWREMTRASSASSESPALGLNQSFEETQSIDAFTARIAAKAKISRCSELIVLPRHRHRLTDACIVCEVLSKPRVAQINIHEDKNNDSDAMIVINEDNSVALKNGEDYTETLDSKEQKQSEDETNNSCAKSKESIKSLEISDMINEQLTKFVEDVDSSRKVNECADSPDSLREYVKCSGENKYSSGNALDVANVYECDSKTEIPIEEAIFSDISF